MKINKIALIVSALILGLIACKNVKTTSKSTTQKTVAITLNAKSGSTVSGEVVFVEKDGVVNMSAKISGLEPGEHAIHLHQVSDCSSEDGKSAGGHWNPTAQPHGKWGDKAGYHKGDIGNFTADENGNGTVVFSTDEWCLSCNDNTKNILGKSVIIHAGTDDHTSQPAGDAGARISCAGIIE